MTIESFVFGVLDNVPVPGFILRNSHGVTAKLSAYGACLTEMHVPDARGRFADVVLGFDDLPSYVRHKTYFGATCGRFSNRIAGGSFVLDGVRHQLECNENGVNHLHGGFGGFDRKIWSAEAGQASNSVQFSLTSPDGDQGYPGALAATVTYRLTEANELKIRMSAVTDRPTVVNMVQHTYWNLGGHDAGSIGKHLLSIDADHFLPVDVRLIPTGEVTRVQGTAFDFRQEKPIEAGLAELGGVFDHNWCLNGPAGGVRPCLRLVDRNSGRGLEIATNQPGVQFYCGAYLSEDGPLGKGGARYLPFGGLALETQLPPNAPNTGHFPSARLAPGNLYDHQMNIRFFVE